jgi:hypothetical protein
LSSVGVDESVKTLTSPLFSMESSNSSLQFQDSELLQTSELSQGKKKYWFHLFHLFLLSYEPKYRSNCAKEI